MAPFPHVRSDAATGFTFSKKSRFRFLYFRRNIYVAVVLALAVSATIVRPVMRACAFAQAVERSDLTMPLDARAGDELGAMMRTLHAMRLACSASCMKCATGRT
jgi:nitrogen fixation/metabolism regulation signal transduction histidine kinase